MQSGSLNLAIVIGSTRIGGFGEGIARWFAGEANRHAGFSVDAVDLSAIAWSRRVQLGGDPATGDFLSRIERADAVAIITPEYNHGYPAMLKHAIDQGYSEWHAKPVGFVSYGGMSGGLRAVEQLRQVFSEFHTVTMRDSVSFHRVSRELDAAGMPRDLAGAGEAAQIMLRQLAWWGATLKQARVTTPYVVDGGPQAPPRLLPSPS